MSCGRTGSTLISNILNKHKDLCIISDIIEPIGNNSFIKNKKIKVTGEKFFKEISRKTSNSRIKYWRSHKTKELLYLPKNEEEISLLNCYTLPFLFKDTKKKIEVIKNYFYLQKKKTKNIHLLDFFNLLKDLSGKKIFIERTGGAIHHIDKILDFYPNSKIILNYRNPLETAISMRNYPFFRMYELMRKNKELVNWNFFTKKAHWKYGQMLNGWYKVFFKNFKKIKKKNFCSYSFEKLCTKPDTTLEQLLKFVLNKKKLNSYDYNFINFHKIRIRNIKSKFNELNTIEKNKLTLSLKYTIRNLYASKL